MSSSSPTHHIASPTIFHGLTAWFAPGLQSYVTSWITHGGLVKDIEEAEIAFVSDRTKQNGQTCRPMMKILRPEWIVDSITGKTVVSLNRYKRTFPALESWQASPYHCSSGDVDDDHGSAAIKSLQSGMEAFMNKNMLSFSPSPVALYQPSPDFQYLSLTNSNEARGSNGDSLKIGNHGTPSQSPTATTLPTATISPTATSQRQQRAIRDISIETTRTHSGTIDVAVKELDTFIQGDVSSESDDGTPTTQYWRTMGPSFSQKRTQNHPPVSDQSPIHISDSLPPQHGPKKRRLPETILRIKRPPPATRNIQLDEEFFCTDSEEDADLHFAAKEQSQTRSHSNSTISDSNVDRETEGNSRNKGHSTDREIISMDAEGYLQQVWSTLNSEQRSMLMGTSTQVLSIVNIPETDISMHRRKKNW
ncbi:hypothetical protein EMPS_10118 [Entomortierella parvispora]|uniref:BRCT domain-containing protein n=1 Tax=Entomortierella parvispora TaxID=205924 RepID=A0A9P3HJB0_9FUNG|nr:hypothetical protein EMPS_10118 [Entomortierella parvispora]